MAKKVKTSKMNWKTLVKAHQSPKDDDRTNPPVVYTFGSKRVFRDKRNPAVAPE